MAHLRNFQGSLAGQGLGLLDHGQLIAHQGDAGVGVLVKDVEIVVGGGGADLAGVDIHPAEDAALAGVVAHAAAPAHFQGDIGDVHLAVHQVGADAHGVHGLGMQARHIGMLGLDMLQHHQLLLPDIVQHGRRGFKILHIQLLHAVAAGAVVDLGEDGLLPLQELGHLLRGGGFAVEGGAAEILGEADVKEQLVVKIVVVGHVVHDIADLLVADPGEIGVPLGAGHVVKAEHGVVIIPCAVAHGAPEHIEEGAGLVLAALLVHHVDHVVHLLEADAGEDPGHISDHRHGKKTSRFSFCLLSYHAGDKKSNVLWLCLAKGRGIRSRRSGPGRGFRRKTRPGSGRTGPPGPPSAPPGCRRPGRPGR